MLSKYNGSLNDFKNTSVIAHNTAVTAFYAKKNAEHNNISNADFYCGDAGKVFRELRKNGCSPDIIVVDPPRKGCSAETIDVIANSAPQKIVMISCNPATAARDAKMLSDNGYSVDKVCGVDLFPRTGHVECVVLMSRVEGK